MDAAMSPQMPVMLVIALFYGGEPIITQVGPFESVKACETAAAKARHDLTILPVNERLVRTTCLDQRER